MNRLLPLVAIVVLTAVACSSGSSGTVDPGGAASAADVADVAESSSAADGSDAPDPSAPDDDPAEPSSPPALTSTARGVTADTIQVGVALLDSRPFVDNGDVGARFRVLVDEINTRGGVLGRRLELHIDEFGVVDDIGFEEICTRHTEDEEVFVALVFAFNMDLTCYGGLHDTNVINMLEINESDVTGSTATVLSVASDPMGSLLAGLDELADELSGVGVAINLEAERADDLARVREHLESLGAEVASTTIGSVFGDDFLADQAQNDVFHERWLSDGAEVVVAVGRGAGSSTIGAVDRAGSDLLVIVRGNEGTSLEAFGVDLSGVNLLAIAPVAIDRAAEQSLYGIPECVATLEAATGESIPFRPPTGEPQPLYSAVGSCQLVELLEMILTEAGIDLTNESFRAAAEGLGEFDLVGTPRASLEPGKAFASDPEVDIYVYDAATAAFVPRP